MDKKKKINILEKLILDVEAYAKIMYSTLKKESERIEREKLHNDIVQSYGAIEPYYTKIVGIQKIEVPEFGIGRKNPDIYPNFFEAGLLSGRSNHTHQGIMELKKVYGRILNEEDTVLKEISLSTILNRFRPCCNYISHEINSEKDVQDILWIMLRSNFSVVEREDTLTRFGIKNYRPDFGIPDLKTLIEVKFINEKTDPKKIQEEILADIAGYLNKNADYEEIIAFIYDKANKLRDPEKFLTDLKKTEGINDVIIISSL